MLSVPKGIAGSVLVQFTAGSQTNVNTGSLANNAVVEATLRGPSFPARKLVGRVNEPLLLPPLPLVGDYELNDIKLVDAITGATRFEATPIRVPVQVFDEVLVSRVTSRPLTLAEIQDRGIVIDQQNFRAVEFEVGFVLDGQTIPVRFPVVAPQFQQSTEIIPKAELEARLAEANRINQEIGGTVGLPPELETSRVNIQIQGIAFQPTEPIEEDLALRIPPIPALVVIPGNIGFLNQFFSVQIFTENAAPAGSGLSVVNVAATMALPPGPDRLVSTNYSQPGDDPLRFARVGPDAIIQPVQPVVRPGLDGKVGTADDTKRLLPGEGGQGEFLVEGLQEGLHVMDITLDADLEGLAAGVVKIQGKAAGSVLVKNPNFSLTFAHPRTVRTGEPYDAFVTVLNTSSTVANLVNVTLRQASISGGVLESPELVELGTILPGQSATARYRVRSQRTGAISFSNLTTSDDSTQGRFNLSMGIDERGVALSPDTIAMPDYVNALPPAIINAANRVLGQALSVATAPQLPPNIKKVPKSFITRRVLELAEAGQRLRYGDTLNRVLADVLLDWQGGRERNDGFDQIMRETDAGREWREALVREMEIADSLAASARLATRAADFAGRSEPWLIAASDNGSLELLGNVGSVNTERSAIPYALGYGGTNGQWLASLGGSNLLFRFRFTNAPAVGDASLLVLGTNGSGRLLRWNIPTPDPNTCFTFDPASLDSSLVADLNCDGSPDSLIAGTSNAVLELPPTVLAVLQDTNVNVGRPPAPCNTVPQEPRNYGTVLAVMFSKPMTQERVNVPSAYVLSNSNSANFVQIQPGGRVALLNMRLPLSALKSRSLIVTNVADLRGNLIVAATNQVQSDLRSGVSIKGRVARGDGNSAANVPVTLTMYDQQIAGRECRPAIVRVSQVPTDENGFFEFDYVMAGIPYSISATDTRGLTAEAAELIAEASTPEGISTQRLLELARASATLAQQLGLSTGPANQAIAAAEGVDRAMLKDFVGLGSVRMGTEVSVALRFRGRGTVAGQVLAADGVTPLSGVAVNLFPDPDSRELGRGVFSGADGRFAFAGVPLGIFTIGATNSAGLIRVVSDIIDTPGQTKEVTVVLSSSAVTRTSLAGRVLESDGTTPHAGATVMVGQFSENFGFCCVVAVATSDENGYWMAEGVPVDGYDLVAISLDGRRKGERRDVLAVSGVVAQANITLQGRTTVYGRVETSTGVPVPGAMVGGGDVLVRTDASGQFTLTGVPTGLRTISAGIERSPALGFDFPRLGSASLNVIAGVDNFVIIRFEPRGSISGRVLNELGQPVPNVNVALPEEGGFSYVQADANGNYIFENLPLGQYTVSAPAPVVANTDVSGILDTLRGDPSEDQIKAAIGEVFAIFTGVNDPFLNGSGSSFNPGNWGFTNISIKFDGDPAVADIRYIPVGTIGGKVINGQSVPIGAAVRLTGIGPLPNGDVGFRIRGDTISDPATGEFSFPNAAFIGSFGLQAASPFFPVVISASGFTTSINPNSTSNILQFPATREVNGRLAGRVFNPDGSPVGAGVKVGISFGSDYVIETDTNGVFDTQIALPALDNEGRPGVGYTLLATNLDTGLIGHASAIVLPGITNTANVTLLGKGTAEVLVTLNDGSPATNASVEIWGAGFPSERLNGFADANGFIRFANVFEGYYGVSASLSTGPTVVFGRSGVEVGRDQTNNVALRLSPTGTIRGKFVKQNGVTPITAAQIRVGVLGFATTGANGFFELAGVPLGTYRVSGRDPVSGRGGFVDVTLSFNGEIREVRLIEQALVELTGAVMDSYGTSFVPGATVTLTVNDQGFTPSRTVTTGPDGRFLFPGTPFGSISLQAQDPVSDIAGFASANIPTTATTFDVVVPLRPLANINVFVFEPDGVTPAAGAIVTMSGASPGTDQNGRARFERMALGQHPVQVVSGAPGSRSGVLTNVSLTAVGNAPDFGVRLLGVGSVSGRVFLSDGVTPAPNAEVELTINAPQFGGQREVMFTDAQGNYAFSNISVGAYRLVVRAQALGASVSADIGADGEMDVLNLTLGASGSVLGILTRADDTTPVNDANALLTFPSQSGLPGRAQVRTAADGSFRFDNVPVGTNQLEVVVPQFGGIARASSILSTNGQANNLGIVRLDEADPRVVQVTPADTAAGVPIATVVELTFSEALDSASVNSNGVFVRLLDATNVVPASVQVLPDPTNAQPRLVRITPLSPLLSERTYEVVAVNGERLGALGQVIATGPKDFVGRPLPAPFISRFTTADNDPPVLVSLFPSNNAAQIDPRSVPRLSFNEPIQSSNLVMTLAGPGGPVAGTVALGMNNTVLTFTPAAEMPINALLTVSVSNVVDLAGNAALNQPITSTFASLDTLGPTNTLQIVGGASPVAGATVMVESALAVGEPGVFVSFTQDLNPIGTDTTAPFRVNVTLPASGATIIRATATDRFGNPGPFAELVINVVSNQPPAIFLTRTPPSGALTNGQPFSVTVSATDDVAVSNVVLVGVGPIHLATNFNTGATNVLSFVVPTNAGPGQIFQFHAQATDALGLASAEAVLEIPVIDGVSPQVTILSPPAGSVLNPTQPLSLVVASADNSTNHHLEVTLSGAITATQTLAVVVAANATVTNTFTFSLTGAPTDGSTLLATVRAMDAASNAMAVTRSFTLPDTRPPRLLTTTPTNNAPRQSLWLAGAFFDFDEALNPSTVTTNGVLVTNSVGAVTPFTVFTTNDNQRVVVRLNRPLVPGAFYTNTLLSGIRDASSNAFVSADGTPIPTGGISSTFATAAILGVTPTNGTRVIAGQNVPVTVNYEAGLGAGFFRFQFDTNSPVQSTAGATSAAGSVVIPTNATSASIAIFASDNASFTEPVTLDPVSLLVEPLNGDADGDGMTNSFELTFNFDPFFNDAGLDADSDGLSNLQESQRGTNPRLADSDTDGLNDGAEVALGTNPLNPDTDGDGLLDGIDPDPLQAFSGVVFTGTNRLDVVEGQTTNLVIQVSSTNGAVVLFDYSPTNLPPPFISLKSRSFVNTSSNGVGTIELELNPLHDAAGSHTFTLRAAGASGQSGTFDVTVVVADDPALDVTRWKDPVNGNWNDPTRWDNGLPDATKVGVIDVVGNYAINLNASITAAGVVLGHSNAVLQTTTSPTLNAPIEIRSGRFAVNSSSTITLNRPLANLGTLRWISGNHAFTLQGSGRVENAGLWEVYQDPGCPTCTSESWVQVPVNVPVGGRLLVSTNADLLLRTSTGVLTIAGELEIQSGARLRLENSSPALDLTLLAGSTLSGTGTIQVDGSNRLVVPGDFDSTIFLQLNSSARLVAPGTYYVRTSRSMSGVLQVGAVVIATNATFTVSSTSFPVPVSVEAGGRLRLTGGLVSFATNVLVVAAAALDVDLSTTVTLNGVLTNLGTLRWISGNHAFTLQG
ncbi:MAG: carboxypeptidase regulatory-like domain-containing protein, partial [Verrucomicrobia bacterium]|nr:carboxypeptidase regulatory-like domain-containing protein [Verrucomicrobiota bacterium]